MNNWQELMDYVYGEIDNVPYYKNYKPTVNNVLNLANESLLNLTVDYISFSNSEALSDVSVVDIPNTCVEVFKIELDGVEIKRCDINMLQYEVNELAYCVTDYKILFNKKFSCEINKFEIIGKGKFSLFTKSASDNTIFKLIPAQFHYIMPYFILHRLFLRGKDTELARYYLDMYNDLFRKYEWQLVVRRTREATFDMDYDIKDYDGVFYECYANIPTEFNSGDTISPEQVDQKIASAIATSEAKTYTKAQIDSKDSGVLTTAKGYTYSQGEIDSKDTTVLNNSKAYTEDKVGNIEDEVDDILGG